MKNLVQQYQQQEDVNYQNGFHEEDSELDHSFGKQQTFD